MKNKAEVFTRMVARINSVVNEPGGLSAKDVSAILNELEDLELQRLILAQFLMSACCKGDVSEVVGWTVVMSYMEGKLPATDVQLEAMHLFTQH